MIYDLCIIGGGINGAGIARDAAGRGLSVLLLEKGDLAEATSSKSSKMIHGGLRYLEFFEFGLVRKSLAERETLLRIAPQIVSPLRLCIPHRNAVRPAALVRMGLFLYDHLTRMNRLPTSETVSLKTHPFGAPLKDRSGVGFAYSDCWVDDARLVVLNAMDAAAHGADIRVRCAAKSVVPVNGHWRIHTDQGNFESRIIVNAAGPYAASFLQDQNLVRPTTPALRLVQGSHIVIPKLYEGDHAYLIQCPDRRVVFVFPYEGEFTLVGTTETAYHGDPKDAHITEGEMAYLCDVVTREFAKPVTAQDVIWSYSGVRPLFDDKQESDARTVTRDYKLVMDDHQGAKILTVFGGKLTTYRPLAEDVMECLRPVFSDMGADMGPAWTAEAVMPLIDFKFQPDEKTIRHFIRNEWAQDVTDVLWRRTKWGLHMNAADQADLKTMFDRVWAAEKGGQP